MSRYSIRIQVALVLFLLCSFTSVTLRADGGSTVCNPGVGHVVGSQPKPSGPSLANLPVAGWMFDTSNYPARWNCGTWSLEMGYLHIVSDILIFAAYTAIPLLLVWFARRRNDIPFLPVLWLFAGFILFCGVGHLVEAIIFWHPVYGFAGLLKLCTAIVSWATVLALIPIVPKALMLPGLVDVNKHLHAEVKRRESIERSLEQRALELEETNQDLERFAASVVDREERVIELKEEVNGLLAELGRVPCYLREASHS